jgi:DNA-binding response OmpR family regulator
MPTILCFHDDTYAFARLLRVLESSGFQVVAVRDKMEGLALAREQQFDAAIMDCHMERADYVATALRIVKAGMPILMVSAFCNSPCRMSAHADACVQRAENANQVLQSLNLILRSAEYGLCRSVPDKFVA